MCTQALEFSGWPAEAMQQECEFVAQQLLYCYVNALLAHLPEGAAICTFMLKPWISPEWGLSRSYCGVCSVLQSSLLYTYLLEQASLNTACVHRCYVLVALSLLVYTCTLNTISLWFLSKTWFSPLCEIRTLNDVVPVFLLSFCTLSACGHGDLCLAPRS